MELMRESVRNFVDFSQIRQYCTHSLTINVIEKHFRI